MRKLELSCLSHDLAFLKTLCVICFLLNVLILRELLAPQMQ
tara:strand:- start:89 stop:211 length:123 start_codon:yes stop_codon:yes gene_type:complete